MACLRMYDGGWWLIFPSLSFILFQDPITITVCHVYASWRPRNFVCGMYRAAYGTLGLCSCRYSRKIKALIHSLVSVIITSMWVFLSFPFLLILFQDPITITVYHVCASWRPRNFACGMYRAAYGTLGLCPCRYSRKIKDLIRSTFPYIYIVLSLAIFSCILFTSLVIGVTLWYFFLDHSCSLCLDL